MYGRVTPQHHGHQLHTRSTVTRELQPRGPWPLQSLAQEPPHPLILLPLGAGRLAQVSGHPSPPFCRTAAARHSPQRLRGPGVLVSSLLTHRALQGAELSRCVAVREPPAGLPWPLADPFSSIPPAPTHAGAHWSGFLGPLQNERARRHRKPEQKTFPFSWLHVPTLSLELLSLTLSNPFFPQSPGILSGV